MSKTIKVSLTMTHTNTVNNFNQVIEDNTSFMAVARDIFNTIKSQEWIMIEDDKQLVAFRCAEIAFFQVKVVE